MQSALFLIVASLPLVFMFHDFEEIIFTKQWIKKNKANLHQRFPKLAARLLLHLEKLSTEAFSLAVAEEFVVLSLVTVYALYSGDYRLWYGLFIAFSVHIIIHIFQWIVYRKYIPCIVTSILVLPYCIYSFLKMSEMEILTFQQKIFWGVSGFVIMVINLILVHKLAAIFDKKFNIK